MEYYVFAAVAVVFVLFVFLQGYMNEKSNITFFKNKLQNNVGKAPDKEYKIERFIRIPGYYEKHQQEGQIDDITWNDLDMDEVFQRMNYSISSTGEEYLYYMLRTPKFNEEELKHFDEIVEFFAGHPQARLNYQLSMRKLGNTGKYSLYDYIGFLTQLGMRSNKKDLISLGLFAAFLVILCFHLTIGVLAIVIWMIYQILTYFQTKREIEAYTTSLAYIMRLISVAEKVQDMLPVVCYDEKMTIVGARKGLKKSKQGAFWIFNSGNSRTSGSPFDAILDYVRMVTHIDLIYFNRMLGELINHLGDIDTLVTTLGYLESAISVGLYRASLSNGYCKPSFTGEGMNLKNGYHPLITEPVKNSITAKKGVLLTGSNASGKSTFLKMLALNTLTAQTIYTASADVYEAPFYHLFSSMSLRDSLESGESYYIVEIKAIKRILDSHKKKKEKVLCFVDEVLRGTNTVERIAASTQILLSMTGEGIQCFAATHDIELTHLLMDTYNNYHFEEEILEGDVVFNYRLKSGRATTRNAINLLEVMGYEEEIIQSARKQADVFMQEGTWKLP